MTDEERLAAEQRARVLIDRQLTGAGWVVQDRRELNLFAGQGVAVREVIMARGHGRADYLIYIDQKAVGVIEAKPAGTTLSGVEWQSSMYAEGLPAEVRLKAVTTDGRLPFVFEASGSETHFTNGYDPNPRARRVFAFPQPATLARTLRDAQADPEHPTWRGKVTVMPELNTKMLRPAQITAISGIGQVPKGEVTMEIVFDPPGHLRLPIEDDEIVDGALAIQTLAGQPVTMITFDTGQAHRARMRGLKTLKLEMPKRQEPQRTSRPGK